MERAASDGHIASITRNDELILADTDVDLALVAERMSAAASDALGFAVRVRAQRIGGR